MLSKIRPASYQSKPIKKTYRILSLADVLRRLSKHFGWFNLNCIYIDLPLGNQFQIKYLLITANHLGYTLRFQSRTNSGKENFFMKEIEQPTGTRLLFELVCDGYLDETFLPNTDNYTKQIQNVL